MDMLAKPCILKKKKFASAGNWMWCVSHQNTTIQYPTAR